MSIPKTLSSVLWMFRRVLAEVSYKANCYCIICERKVQRFLPYRGGWAEVPPFMKHLGIIGSDVETYECPVCGSHDRERHLLMYLEVTGLLPKMRGSRILHLAPERHLQRYIRNAMPIEYILGDLHPDRPDIERIDLQAIPYSAEYFDYVLANHVLEHVHDDMQALREIFRVLRRGGYAILQTPYSSILKRMFQDSGIQSEAARLQAYGQEDHCRLYGRDIFQRFETVGFRSFSAEHSNILSNIDPIVHGVNADESLCLFQKPFQNED